MTSPSRLGLIAAFAAIYLIWGSTYLAIRIAIETLPPFAMASVRFLVAGALTYAFARLRGVPRPSFEHWKSATLVGGLMMFGGNGLVTFAESHVSSAVAAVLVATMPLWMTALDARFFSRRAPGGLERAGLVTGLAGVALLIAPSASDVAEVHLGGAILVVLAAALWATGSLLSRQVALPSSLAMSAALQMLMGGAILAAASWLCREPAISAFQACSTRSAVAVVYLIVFGSIIAISAYLWLLRVAAPAAVGTYAFVNPVIAVFLGWLVLAEPVTPRMVVATLLIVTAVATILVARRRTSRLPPQATTTRSGPAPATVLKPAA